MTPQTEYRRKAFDLNEPLKRKRRRAKGTIHPVRIPTKSEWQMQRQLLSPAFTTRFDQLWTVRAGN
jgi:hypothetical protein